MPLFAVAPGRSPQAEEVRFELEVRRRLKQDCSDILTPEMRRELLEDRAKLMLKLTKLRASREVKLPE